MNDYNYKNPFFPSILNKTGNLERTLRHSASMYKYVSNFEYEA